MPEDELDLFAPDPEEEKETTAKAGDVTDQTPDQTTPTDQPVKDEELENEGKEAEADKEEPEGGEKGKKPERTYPKSVVDKLIENRLGRDRRVREQEFSKAAGVRMTHDDVKNAAKLWGFLIQNPEVNTKIGQLIQEYYSTGKVTQSLQADTVAEKEKELALKEAIIDLRAKDRTFRQHEGEIIEWADLNGYEIEDPKTLRLAVMAWKGENMSQIVSDAQKKAQEDTAARAQKKQDAALLPGKGVRAQTKPDYKKMTPEEILKAEGLSLFTKDE